MAERKYIEAVLPNGIRLIHKEKQSEIAHLVLMVETGTRDELPHENGLAHFVEHTIFKGTQNRKAYHILSCLDNVGGDLNAFTTKEETCIQATFLKQPSTPLSPKTNWPRKRKSFWTKSIPTSTRLQMRSTTCLKRWSSKDILWHATFWEPPSW